MDTAIIKLQENYSDDATLRKAGEILKAGGLVAFPTETVYGLGGDALNPASSRKIYAAKGRPSDNPLIVHICCMEDLERITADVSEKARKLAEAFWPGPLTMVLPKSEAVPRETTGGLDTVAVRMPSHRAARKMIEYAGGFVAAPSANVSGRPSPTVAKYVVEDMQGRVDMILDGGEVGIGLESTIVDMTVEPPQILRPGYITEAMLSEVLGEVEKDATLFAGDTGLAPKAPGMKYRHYAPKGQLVIVRGEQDRVVEYINESVRALQGAREKTGVIAVTETAGRYTADVVKTAGDRRDEETIARHLYTILREFDDENVTRIFSESFGSEEPQSTGLGQAIMNRLLKAAGHQIIYLQEVQNDSNRK